MGSENKQSIIATIDNNACKLQILGIAYNDFSGCVTVQILRINDWYDQIESYTADCVIEHNKTTLSFTNGFAPGLYFLMSITADTGETIIDFKCERISYRLSFVIGHRQEWSVEELRNVYTKVLNSREEAFQKPKGNVSEGQEVFDCFVFVKNINPITQLQYGDIGIIPFNEYKALSEAYVIDEYFKKDYPDFDYSSSLQGQFGAVIQLMMDVFKESDQECQHICFVSTTKPI